MYVTKSAHLEKACVLYVTFFEQELATNKCNEYGYMKYKSSSRLACHVTELVGSHLEVLLSLFNRNK